MSQQCHVYEKILCAFYLIVHQ